MSYAFAIDRVDAVVLDIRFDRVDRINDAVVAAVVFVIQSCCGDTCISVRGRCFSATIVVLVVLRVLLDCRQRLIGHWCVSSIGSTFSKWRLIVTSVCVVFGLFARL